MQYGHCLHTNVALGILFISIIVLEGEERQINMQSLSAHIAFYELMPLQECFEEKTYMFFFVFPRPPPVRLRGALISCPPSLPVTRDHVTKRRADIGAPFTKSPFVSVFKALLRAHVGGGARLGDDLNRAVTEVPFLTAGPGGASVRQWMTQSSVATHPEPCLETLRRLATMRGGQREQVNRELFSPAKRRIKARAWRSRKCRARSGGLWIHRITRSIIRPHIDHTT